LSSILRALKKLENEPGHLTEPQSLDNKFMPLADTETQRSVSSIFIMVIGGGIVCGLVILAGWWLFSEKFQPPPTVTKDIPRLGSKQDESPAPSQRFNKVSHEAVSEKPENISIEAPETPTEVEQIWETVPASLTETALKVAGQEAALPVAEQTPAETSPAQETPSLKADEQVKKPTEKPVIASYSRPATPAKTLDVEIPKLNDPEMKLQAVTWSNAPQKRLAVINNRILREGEMVSGYLISIINQDDVILSRDGTKWKLVFRIK